MATPIAACSGEVHLLVAAALPGVRLADSTTRTAAIVDKGVVTAAGKDTAH